MFMRPQKIVTDWLCECGIDVGGNKPHDIRINDERLFTRVLVHGSLGLGEAYMDGWWDVPDVGSFIHRLLIGRLDERVWSFRAALAYGSAAVFNLQKGHRAFRVGQRHYDIGNDLYERMLDRRMIYSCGYWESAANLDEAQEAKLRLVFRKLDLKPGQRVLDIGCGWGGALQLAAAEYGVEGVGITVSKEQAAHGGLMCRGLPVAILLKDYRDLTATFDRIFSIGMFEHVGIKNYRIYMATVHRSLRPGGRFLLHTIGSTDDNERGDPWITKYIFPNSVLPSQTQIVRAAEGLFAIEGWQRIGAHYVPTLYAWRDNFDRHWPKLRKGRDERFRRMWHYYLGVSAAAFRAASADVWQVLLTPLRGRGGDITSRPRRPPAGRASSTAR